MKKVPNILWLAEIQKEDIPSVGGKGASLGEMTSVGLPVPNAFVVTAQAFRWYIENAKIDKKIFSLLGGLDVDNSDLLEKTAKDVRSIVMKTPVPDKIKEEIARAYIQLGDNVIVAVRSSATAEDLPEASFAGQQDTYLNIKGINALIESIQKCWASLYTARAIYYRAKQGFDDSLVDIAVVVQELVFSEKAGVLFSSHPVTGEPTSIIEGSWGLGESVVSGSVSPDNYIFDQRSGRIIDRYIATKKTEIVPDGDHGTKEVAVSPERQVAAVLSDAEITALAKFGKVSEVHYGVPQDMEWGIVGDTIYILQSRPLTTIVGKTSAAKNVKSSSGRIILEGQGASPGIATGRVVLVTGVKDLGRIKEGDIMVTKMTNPDMVLGMRKVSAIITDEGGMTCHAAIVSRELGTPAVVGTRKATQVLKEGDIVTVDGEKGIVFEGAVALSAETAPAGVVGAAGPVATYAAPPIITGTSIKVNVSLAEAAGRAAATGADGVGLLRIEHMILALGKTPGWYIKNHKEEEFITELYDGIKTILDAFPGKPVWVRTLDAPTDEFRNMQGGEDENVEHNPMLGWRGIRRDLQQPEQFRLQVEVFKRLWAQGYSNMGLMFPLVGHPDEFIRAKQMLADWGVDVKNTTLGIMVEVPSSVLMIDEFIAAGINFASFGTNDLIQYTLAIDRNNQNVADMYFPKHPAVLRLIKYAIGRCREGGVECSICGQAGSDPDMVEWLIQTGITSVSANIDAVQKIRERAARTEQRMLLDMARR
ncbi:MAG: phosphoenolpyruvate synthase [Methanomicrobiales archaeon]|nr:phosphoenolpyruvate synthase [Methanomicrobiales archaeon]